MVFINVVLKNYISIALLLCFLCIYLIISLFRYSSGDKTGNSDFLKSLPFLVIRILQCVAVTHSILQPALRSSMANF